MARISKLSWPANRVVVQSDEDARHPHPRPLSRGGERGVEMRRILLQSSLLYPLVGLLFWSQGVGAQDRAAESAVRAAAGEAEPVVFTTEQDHQNMKQQLGITKLRPGRNPNEGSTNLPNYDEAQANPYPHLPGV